MQITQMPLIFLAANFSDFHRFLVRMVAEVLEATDDSFVSNIKSETENSFGAT